MENTNSTGSFERFFPLNRDAGQPQPPAPATTEAELAEVARSYAERHETMRQRIEAVTGGRSDPD